MPLPILALANLAGGALSSLIGGSQRRKARKALNGMEYPIEQIPDEVLQNQNQANQMAGQGLPSEQYNKSVRDIQRQQLMTLRRANNRRGGLMALPSILQGGTDATLNLNAADAAQRLNNQRYAIGVNNEVANWRSQLFDRNIRNKYNRDFDYNMSLLGQGNQNLFGGVEKGIAGGAELIGGLFKRGKRRATSSITSDEDLVHY